MNDQIKKAIEILKNGGVGIFPTDTVYGIGCKLDDEKAIERVFSIRNRDREKPVLAVVDSIKMAQKYLLPIPEDVRKKLMDTYWPGQVTVILPCKKELVPAVARANGATLGVRQTDNPILLEILKEIQVPLVAPSANFSGDKAPGKFSDINPQLLLLVDFVIKLPSGGNMPSTVIDCSVNPWKILRQGAVQLEL